MADPATPLPADADPPTDMPADASRGGRGLSRPAPSQPPNILLSTIGMTLAVLATLTAGVAGYYGEILEHHLRRIHHEPGLLLTSRANDSLLSGTSGPMDVLILTTVRAGDATLLTDSVQLLHLAQNRRAAHLVSFPTDLRVEIPGHGLGTLQQAFAEGRAPLVASTLEAMLGLQLTHGVMIRFSDALEMSTVVGEPDDAAHELFDVPGGDHQLLQHLLTHAIHSGSLLADPSHFSRIVALVGRCLTVDAGLTVPEALRIVVDLRTNTPEVRSLVPALAESQPLSAAARADPAALRELAEALRADDLNSYAAARP